MSVFCCAPCSVDNSVINTDPETDKSFFITTSHGARDGREQPLAAGRTRASDGQEELVITLVLVAKPRTVIEACYLEVSDGTRRRALSTNHDSALVQAKQRFGP